MRDYFSQVSDNLLRAKDEEKAIFISTLATLSNLDNKIRKEEKIFLEHLSKEMDITFHPHFLAHTPKDCIKNVSQIKDSCVCLELIKDMFALAYVDDNFSSEEANFIYEIGKALKIKPSKLKQISSWIADRIIWLEQGAIIFNDLKPNKKQAPKTTPKKVRKTK